MQKNKKKIGIGYYLKQHKIAIFFYVFFTLMATAIIAVSTLLTARVIEFIAEGNYSDAIKWSFIIIGLMLFKSLCWYITSLLYHITSGKLRFKLNRDLSTQSFRINSKTFSDNGTGFFVERIVSDPVTVVDSLSDVVSYITEIISDIVILTYIATLDYRIALILVGIISACMIIEFFRQKVYNKNLKLTKESGDKINSLTTEIVKSERDIKSLGLEKSLSKIAAKNYDNDRKAQLKQGLWEVHFWRIRNIIVDVVGILMLIYAIKLLDRNLITIATFMLVYSYRENIYGFTWNLGNVANVFTQIKVSSERMFSLFDENLVEIEKFGNKKADICNGEIEFKNISFTYRDYKIEKDKKLKKNVKKLETESLVFEDLSFKIPKNKTVAFVGKSGSGKSTILGLMTKIHNVDKGEVLLDGINIQDLDKESLRKSFSLVNQFPYIFDMTIKENLKLANQDATDEEINKAIKMAYFDEFINSLPNGIETKVGESGIKLSGGQKQRLAIARALLRKSPIILFDESTSSLDNIAQSEVKKSIDNLKGQGTIVVVAHRLSTIKDSDIIFFLDEGKIIAQDTFEELFDTNEKFKNMFLAENI